LSKVNGFEAKLKVFFGFVEEPPIRGAFSGEVEFWQSGWEGLSKVQTADHEVEDGLGYDQWFLAGCLPPIEH